MQRRFDGAKVTVLGLGRFGGGLGAARFLLSQGAAVLLTDAASEELLAAPLAELRAAAGGSPGSLQLRLGGHEERDFISADLVVASPAVPKPWQHPCLHACLERGVPITTEISLAIGQLPSHRFIGVTGSAGKSSTAAMTAEALPQLGIAATLGGNIGGSLLDRIGEIPPNAWIVLELSSFMLHWLGQGASAWSPQIAILTNIRPNHLDWHGEFGHYARSKGAIVAAQAEPFLISRFHLEDPDAAREAAAAGGDWWSAPAEAGRPFVEAIDPARIELAIPGEHQRRNARLALAAALAAAARDGPSHAPAGSDSLHAALRSFAGLPDRLERIPAPPGVLAFNDSKSTTPEATLLAVAAFPQPSKIHLIAGGADKGVDLSPIASLAERLAGVYAVGVTATRLAKAPGVTLSGTVAQAVRDAAPRLREGELLLLSPGCASWDQHADYRDRASVFRRACEGIAELRKPSRPRRGSAAASAQS